MVTSFISKQHLTVYILVLTYILAMKKNQNLLHRILPLRQGRDQLVNANLCLENPHDADKMYVVYIHVLHLHPEYRY